MKRIGLFGGSFDPVHNAHVALAKSALDHLELDELRWVPAGKPWQKAGRDMVSGLDRAAMIALATAREPRFVLERAELSRKGASYTIDTVRELQEREDAEWFLIIGQDQLAGFARWRSWRELLRCVTLAVAARADSPVEVGDSVREAIHTLVEVPLPPMDISSSLVRERLARGESVAGMVPDAVARYIDHHQLYRGITGS
ncbi:MAG: nicotinate-nicotinamide nucleotide adenylyltransferase [Rhizobacter sp.]|nr:nicotinate-nicotinamide nucleotide adenylyltransferase [Rhizobacter sp.]